MGGTWQQQNKSLPGAYINILGETPLSIKMSQRGIVALPIKLGWGEKGKIYKVHPGDDTVRSLGSSINDIIPLREALKNSSEVLLYKANGGQKASVELTAGVTATAVCEGSRGNAISVVAQGETRNFTISTYLDGVLMDQQTLKSYEEFKPNGFITISGTAEFEAGTKQLASGSDTEAIESDFTAALNTFKTHNFNVIAYGGSISAVKTNIEAYVKEMRENEGVKIQAVMSNHDCDYEGIIVVENGVILEDGTTLSAGDVCYWVAGATAGANVNQSNTGKVYQGAIDVNPRLLKSEMETKCDAGKVIFKVDNSQRVTMVYDINSLTTYVGGKNKSFRKNRVIRTLDNIANDIASIWEHNYMGKIDNTADGRSLYRASLVEYFKALQGLNAIEGFAPEDVTVELGEDSDAIVVNVGVKTVDSAEKLYMTILV